MIIWLDVTTILRWPFRPVGIVRVETELAREWLQRPHWRFRFCRFDQDQRCFVVVPRSAVRALTSLASQPWSRSERRSHRLRRFRRAPAAVSFGRRDSYLSLGADWDDKDVGVLLALKRRHRFRVVLCCHDLIPVLFPQLTLPGASERFPRYLSELVTCADAVLCNSLCTRSDLQAYLCAHALPQPVLTVFRLGTDLPVADEAAEPASGAVQETILRGPFILMVSTLEARKGHALLVSAYKHLCNVPDPAVPRLVLVGMKGWGVDSVLETIEGDPLLSNTITILSGLEDGDLAKLYQACLFTVYPSLYEGWGLPVAESLASGKFCLASDRASLPEVGGEFCDYLNPEDDHLWAERILFYARHRDVLKEKEAHIRRDFRPFSWRQTCNDVLAVVQQSTPSEF